MEHTLPPLPFPIDSLAPHYSREALEFHHGKHHNAYVVNLNDLQKGTEFEAMTLEQIVKKASGGIYNNAAQIWNHTFFWNCMKPNGGGDPTGALAAALNAKWGSQRARWLTAALGGHAVPEEGVVPDLRRVVVDAAARLLDDLFERHRFELGALLQVVEVHHVGIVVLAVVVLEGFLRVLGCQRVKGVRQGWEHMFHGFSRGLVAGNKGF